MSESGANDPSTSDLSTSCGLTVKAEAEIAGRRIQIGGVANVKSSGNWLLVPKHGSIQKPRMARNPFASVVTRFPEADRVYGDRVSMVCLPATLRNAASLYAPLPTLAATPGLSLSHGRASAQPPPGRAFH